MSLNKQEQFVIANFGNKKRLHDAAVNGRKYNFVSKANSLLFFASVKMYLPKAECITLSFLQQVTKGDKKALRCGQVQMCPPTKFGEFSVKKLYELVA